MGNSSVTVSALIDAGLLAPGDEITFEPRRGEVYKGSIGAKGELIFGGKHWGSPSAAATALAGTYSRNGWRHLKVRGRVLSEYREQIKHGAKPPPERTLTGPASDAQQTVREQILAKLRSMNDRQFENFVGQILTELGYEDVDVVGRPGDGGVDVKCVIKASLIEPAVTVVCQVKRHASNVQPSAVGDLRGRWSHRADRLILVNTGGFTQGDREAAKEPGAKEISLVSGEDLADLMIQKGLGVTRRPVVEEKLDETFFSQFS